MKGKERGTLGCASFFLCSENKLCNNHIFIILVVLVELSLNCLDEILYDLTIESIIFS